MNRTANQMEAKCRYFEDICFSFRRRTQINSKRGIVTNYKRWNDQQLPTITSKNSTITSKLFRTTNEQSNSNTILGRVHTYPDIFESATFSFRIRPSSTRIRRIRKQIRKFLNPLSRVEIFESDNISDTCGRSNPDIF